MLSVGITYSMRDQVCDVIKYCDSSFAKWRIKCTCIWIVN